MSANHKTFDLQDNLPSLPVPGLEQTLDKYLESARIHLTSHEYENTRKLVDNFRREDGQKLQNALENRARTNRNWFSSVALKKSVADLLAIHERRRRTEQEPCFFMYGAINEAESYWDRAYHGGRYPIYPLVNIGGLAPDNANLPPKPGSEIERASLAMFFAMQYWKLVREEKVPVMFNRKTPWCMNQVKRIFNSCRIPQPETDYLSFHFKTASEGPCPSHIVVLCRGHLWRMELLDIDGNIYTPPQIEKVLSMIQKKSSSAIPSIGALTAADRVSWLKNRQHLCLLGNNQIHLDTIESAVLVLCLTDDSPVKLSEVHLAEYGVMGDCRNVFADKNLNWYFHRNGQSSFNAEHSIADGIVFMLLMDFVQKKIAKIGFKWNVGEADAVEVAVPPCEYMKFEIDEAVQTAIDKSMATFYETTSQLEIGAFEFTGFGQNVFRKLRIYGDTIVQMAIQLAYFKIHGRPAPTYETASTRKFFHGRTETVRSCTRESVSWCRIMLDSLSTRKDRIKALKKAMEMHNILMAEAMEGQGIDRHFLGLRSMAAELKLPDPEIFKDPGWPKSGGDGNFLISTSFLGYSSVFGCVAPMCTDCYGCFYKINDSKYDGSGLLNS